MVKIPQEIYMTNVNVLIIVSLTTLLEKPEYNDVSNFVTRATFGFVPPIGYCLDLRGLKGYELRIDDATFEEKEFGKPSIIRLMCSPKDQLPGIAETLLQIFREDARWKPEQ